MFVAVRSQVSALLRETVSQRMFVVFVETLGRRRVDFAVEKFVTRNRTAVGTGGLTTPSHSRHSQMLANLKEGRWEVEVERRIRLRKKMKLHGVGRGVTEDQGIESIRMELGRKIERRREEHGKTERKKQRGRKVKGGR